MNTESRHNVLCSLICFIIRQHSFVGDFFVFPPHFIHSARNFVQPNRKRLVAVAVWRNFVAEIKIKKHYEKILEDYWHSLFGRNFGDWHCVVVFAHKQSVARCHGWRHCCTHWLHACAEQLCRLFAQSAAEKAW